MAKKPTKAEKIKSEKRASRGLPSRVQLLAFITENPEIATKREITRAFNIKGSAKIDLKAMLKEMVRDEMIEKRGKRFAEIDQLPNVLVLDIVARDRDGGLLAKPSNHDENSEKPIPVISIDSDKKSSIVAGVGSRVLARLQRSKSDGADYHAQIIKLLERERNAELGVLRMKGDEVRLVPVTKRQDELIVPKEWLNGAKDGDLVEIEPARSNKNYGLKRGKVRQVIGSAITEKAISMIAIHANEIPHIFSDATLQEAEEVKPISLKGKDNIASSHEDWRELPLITIDPADAKDHDDAIHGEPDPDVTGGYIATVAIADVSHYIRSETSMDKEALLRGNSVYFPDRVVPMLPERISNDLCSLRENEDRPALAVRMWFDATGKKRKHSFHRILMRSHAKLSYVEAQAAIDGSPNEHAKQFIDPILKPLWETYACLKRGRGDRAPLELDLPERKILLKEDGTVDRVIVPDRLDAHKLVEEFMIQANVCAAESLIGKKQPLIFRIHDSPSLDRLESLRDFLKSLSITLEHSGNLKARHFNGILKSVEGTDEEELVNQVVLRSQSQAVYSAENIGHFGLSLQNYAHFTSPIRRYADLIVHRALVGALGLGPGGITPDEEKQLDVIAADISMTERRAMVAERETKDRLIAAFLSEQIGERFYGRINGVTKAGLFVTLADSGADGFIPISKISDDYYHFDAATHSLIGEKTSLAYQMGMEVEVSLIEAAPLAGALRFEMISDGKKIEGLERARRTNEKHKPRRSFGRNNSHKKYRKRS